MSIKSVITNQVLDVLGVDLPEFAEERFSFILEDGSLPEVRQDRFKCLCCRKVFVDLASLWKSCHLPHANRAVEEESTVEPLQLVSGGTSKSCNVEVERGDEDRRFICDICGAGYKHKSTLGMHLRRHRAETEWWSMGRAYESQHLSARTKVSTLGKRRNNWKMRNRELKVEEK